MNNDEEFHEAEYAPSFVKVYVLQRPKTKPLHIRKILQLMSEGNAFLTLTEAMAALEKAHEENIGRTAALRTRSYIVYADK